MVFSRDENSVLNRILICAGLMCGLFLPLFPIPLIEQLIIKDNTLNVIPSQLFKSSYLRDNFFVSYDLHDVDLKTLPQSILIMPFLMNVLPIVWLSGLEWEVDELDEELFYSLIQIKTLFKYIYPNAPLSGKLHIKKLIKNVIDGSGDYSFMMPFSGGLDSVATSLTYKNEKQLLVLVREHQGFIDDVQWVAAEKNVQAFAYDQKHDCAFVISNYQRSIKQMREFSATPGLSRGTSHGLGWLGILAPLAVAKRCNRIKIASSITWNYPHQKILCPMIDDTLRCASITVMHDGFDLSRVDKMEHVAPALLNTTSWSIYVCQKSTNGKNCCSCEKCLRTIAALLALNYVDLYHYGFDLSQDAAEASIEKLISYWATNAPWRLESLQKKIRDKGLQSTSHFLHKLSSACYQEPKKIIDYKKFADQLNALRQKAQALHNKELYV